MTGWTLADTDPAGPSALVFGANPECLNITTLAPAQALALEPQSDSNVCGFTFGVSYRCAPPLLPQTSLL